VLACCLPSSRAAVAKVLTPPEQPLRQGRCQAAPSVFALAAEASQHDGTGRGAHLDELLHVNTGVDNVTPSAATLGESRHTVADLLSPIELR